MKHHQERLEVATRGRGFTDITGAVAAVVARSGVKTGLCTVFIQHTSAGLVIQENADRTVRTDLETWIDGVAPESERWQHDAEGDDDMPAHIRSVLTRTSETVPIAEGHLALGTWQALYLWEHRTRPHTRKIVIHVTGIP